MKILAIEREMPGLSAEAFKPLLKPEAARVWELQQSGIIREIYFGRKSHNAVIIMECKDEMEAAEYLGTLPLVKERLIVFETTELEPYSGFARMFGGCTE
ncbi:MAG TPA: superoxide dismutase [Negativicutes bacterium]|nr:superoxide dismutase [Negativicutes bacterium]